MGNARLNLALERWCKRFRDEVVRIDIEHDEWEEQLLSYAGSYDMLFETVSGSTELKKRVVQALDRHMTSKSVRMSSFLSHTITEIASWSQNAKSWLGFHPLHFDRLECLELSVPMQADSPLLEHLQALFAEREKRLVRIRDIVGGVFPRTLALIVNEAVYALQEGVATVQDIDTAMKKGTNYPVDLSNGRIRSALIIFFSSYKVCTVSTEMIAIVLHLIF